MADRIGLKHLAEQLGMDVSTVSRALRLDPRVRPETISAVRALADTLGYRPNATARALRGGRTGRVAVLLSPPQQRFASPIFLELLATLDQRLRGTGRTLAVFAAQQRDEEAGIVRSIVEERLADAIIIGRTRVADDRIRYLLDVGFPFVTFGRTDWPDAHSWVEIDYALAGEIAVEALAQTGPEAIHVISGPQGQRFADNYVAGAVARAQSLGLPVPQVQRAEMTEATGEALARPVFAAPGRVALACIQDSIAFGVFRAAAAAAEPLGRRVTLFGGQNFPGSEHTSPPLSTFSTEDSRVADLLSTVMLDRLDASPHLAEGHVIKPLALLRKSHLLAGTPG